MTLFREIVNREVRNDLWKCWQHNLDHVLERLTCVKQDEYPIEGHEGGYVVPLACQFSDRDPHLLAVADEDGAVLVYDTNKPLHDVLQEWRAHDNAVFDVSWVPQEGRFVTASGDQSLMLWDIETEESIATYKGHHSSVKTVSFRPSDKFVFASGARDGHVMFWDSRTSQKDGVIPPTNIIHRAHIKMGETPGRKKQAKTANQENNSVTSVVFQDDHTLITAGSTDGVIKLWDMRKTYTNLKCEPLPKHCIKYPGSSKNRRHGFSHLMLDSDRSRLFANCMDHYIYQFNVASLKSQPVAVYKGHQNGDFYIRSSLSRDDMYLLSGSSDNYAYMWKVDEPQRSPLILNGHQGEVSAVCWCPTEITKCVTLSDDCSVRLWRMPPSQDAINTQPLTSVVGNCQKTCKEKCVGTSRNGASPVSSATSGASSVPWLNVPPSPMKSPRKGNMLPQSPAKMLSPSVKAGLMAMSKDSSPVVNKRLVSPSIRHWFGKTPSPSPVKNSPRKTPRKLNVILSPRKPLTNSSIGKDSVNGPGTAPRSCTGAKRKLLDASPTTPASKRRLLQSDENCDLLGASDIPHQNPGLDTTPSHVLMPRESNIADPDKCTKKLNFGESSGFSSPTMNLPNYVINPQPRTPVGAELTDDRHRTPDWLTQIRQGKQSQGQEGESSDIAPTTPKLPGKKFRTPRASPRLAKTPSQGRKSILHYMSPKTNNTKDSTSK